MTSPIPSTATPMTFALPSLAWKPSCRCPSAAASSFPASEIYGGINAVWDYGPLGVELKNNVKRAWWRAMVQERDDIVGLDAGILMHPQVWVTSGHVGSFSDPLVECADLPSAVPLDELPGAEALSATDLRDPHRRPAGAAAQRRWPAVGAAPVQPDVQDVHGPRRGRSLDRLPAPRDRAGLVRQLQERPAGRWPQAVPSASPRSASASGTRSPPATSCSGCASSSRWRCSTSCARTSRGRGVRGVAAAPLGLVRAYGADPGAAPACASTHPMSWPTTRRRPIDIEYRFPFGWKELEGIHNRGDFDLGNHQRVGREPGVLRPAHQ